MTARQGSEDLRGALAQAVTRLPAAYLEGRRWFGGKGRGVRQVDLDAAHRVPVSGQEAWYCLVRVTYSDGRSDRYALPVILRPESEAADAAAAFTLEWQGQSYAAVDALNDPAFTRTLYELIQGGQQLADSHGTLRFGHTRVLDEVAARSDPLARVRLVSSEQSNSSIIYGQAFILKLFRRLEEGPNPDLEVLRFLTDHTDFTNVPRIAGFIERTQDRHVSAVGALQTFVENDGDAWQYTLKQLQNAEANEDTLLAGALRLGRVTGGLHVALAAGHDPEFAPEPVTEADTREWQQAVQHELDETLAMLREETPRAPQGYRGGLEELLAREHELRAMPELLGALAGTGVMKTRYHGDYHLGQVLVADGDFIILDFEGEPARSLSERRAKHTPLKDVAGMLRSYSYAGAASVLARPEPADPSTQDRSLAREARMREQFLSGYLAETARATQQLVPRDPEAFRRALRALEFEKAMYELRYEIRNRPDWLQVPLRGITRLLSD